MSKKWCRVWTHWNSSNLPKYHIPEFNPIQNETFWDCSRKLNLSHIFYNDETWHSYTLSKEDLKHIRITWYTLWFLLTFLFAVDLDSVKDVLLIGYFLTLSVDVFRDIGICFFVGLGYRIMEKLLLFLFGYFIKVGCLISRC